MGRITVFSIEECTHCRRAKAAFAERGIPYADINIESHPSKRDDMLSLAGRSSVPQVFFNDEHVGGAEETLATLAQWDEDIANNDGTDKTPHDRYLRLIESEPNPTDERLAIPTGPPAIKSMDFDASRTAEVCKIDDKQYTTLEFTKLLVQRMPRENLSYWGVLYYNVFKGSTGVTALMEMFNLKSREEAVQLGMTLQRKHFLGHVCKDHPFGDNGYYFRLQPFHTPHVLNSFRVWCDPATDKPMHVIHRLGKLWGKLESGHLDKDGMVDHATIRNDDLYWKFEEDVCELQKICLKDMDDPTKTAFVINLYNLMVKYAFVKVGIPANNINRASFFGDVSVDVGGSTFSLDDLEHGILRANTRHPYQLTKPFGKMDSRKQLALKKMDSRIHFALNCGARSCPPVLQYTCEMIDEELRLSAMTFCESEENVSIDVKACQLSLSKILYWYMSDFGSKEELPKIVAGYLNDEKKQQLEKLMENEKRSISVKFLDYDWSSNDINYVTFEKSHLSDKSIFPHSSSPPPQRYETVV